MDVVSREDFEAVREMAALAREENERLAKRLDALEAARRQGSGKATHAPSAVTNRILSIRLFLPRPSVEPGLSVD
jgi:BMFP domain-containing protein YqiC